MDCPIPNLGLLGRSDGPRIIKQLILVDPGPSADQVGIVRRWADADGLGGTSIEVAHVVRDLLQHVGRILAVISPKDLVEKDRVVRRARSACSRIMLVSHRSGWGTRELLTLKRSVGLQEEIPVPHIGYAAVDNCTLLGAL